MKDKRIIQSPNYFIVQEYEPGLTIDLREPPKETDLDKIRNRWRWPDNFISHESAVEFGDKMLLKLGISQKPGDLKRSLLHFADSGDITHAICTACKALSIDGIENPGQQLQAILSATQVLSKPEQMQVRVYCHVPGTVTELEEDSTHFGYALPHSELSGSIIYEGRNYPIYPGTYFCIPGQSYLSGNLQVEVVTVFSYRGQFMLGSNSEEWGRLQYIDGCTDSVLIPPVKLGDPCLNILYFPPNTRQTRHTHPSIRVGVVISGSGVCKTPSGDHPLQTGMIFILPPETWHAFWTPDSSKRCALSVLAFHPDSDYGPTNENHPMLNRTYFEFLHRLKSAERDLSNREIVSNV